MDTAKTLSVAGLSLGTFLLSRHVGTSFALDKPVHTSIFVLASAAVVILAGSRLLSKGGGRTSNSQAYQAVPLSDVGQPHPSRQASPTREDARYPSSLRKLRICFFALICAICARVAVMRYVLANIQCTVLSWEPLIPLLFAAYDYWTSDRHKLVAAYDDPNGSIYEETMNGYVGRSPYRYIYAATLLGIGAMIGLATASVPASTFICASTLGNHWMVPLAQSLGTVLDMAILHCVAKLLEDGGESGARSLSLRARSIGWALLISALATLACGLMYTAFLTTPIQQKRILEIPPYYVSSLMKLTAFACLTVVSACIAVMNFGLTTATLLMTFVSICTITTSHAWNSAAAFPPFGAGLGLSSFVILLIGFAGFLWLNAAPHGSRNTRSLFHEGLPIWFWIILVTLLVARTSLWASSTNSVNFHPIDLLIYDAQKSHESFLNHSSASRSPAQAASLYRLRYGKHPPPGFQHWHKYAMDRNSLVIDSFDTIYRDLQPFWALSPQKIRDRTWDMISNPWHDASGLSIRNGKVEVSPSKFTMPTHAWMLEGLVKMIGNFAEWLPDMDLAFNVNDECRVAVPFEVLEDMRKQVEAAPKVDTRIENTFSPNRAVGWIPLPDEPNGDRVMREMSWQKTFNEFGNAGCPSTSPARTQRHVHPGELCTSCSNPQSIGAFLANWTLANDVCHQPDMAGLHGIYLAPAAFKAAHELYPIFSQSKVSGFNDILYPSAWNYIDKARYEPNEEFPDPPFAEKNSTLFWRGATSEGFSSGSGQWKGMARQRFVHLANGVNGTSNVQHAILIPFDSPSGEHKLRYQNLPLSALTALLPTDVHVVESIARCGGSDCRDQAHEFAPLVPPTDFQTHWSYKYLLDLDGAGFSGRFLPFLHSHSLPFKAAVFREWWDERVTAWQHFVPLDIRGQGFWAALAYFAGIDGKVSGMEIKMEAHEREAERIAEAGRDWAGKVLRKEDMEIYFFRLLLEWGRLTDDRREEIGYADDLG